MRCIAQVGISPESLSAVFFSSISQHLATSSACCTVPSSSGRVSDMTTFTMNGALNSKLRPNQQTANDNSSGWADVAVRKMREGKKRQRNQLGTIDSRLCAQESEYEAVQPEYAEFCRLVREEKEWRGVARTCPELPVQASARP